MKGTRLGRADTEMLHSPPPSRANVLTRRSDSLRFVLQLRGFRAAEGVTLDLKLMLGYGTVIGNYVASSTFNHSEFLISGNPIKQITKIDKAINPGEIIMSQDVYQVVEEVVRVKQGTENGLKILLGVNGEQNFLGGQAAKMLRFSDSENRYLSPFMEASIFDQIKDISYTWSRTSTYKDYTRSRLSRHDTCTTLFVNMVSPKVSKGPVTVSNQSPLTSLSLRSTQFSDPNPQVSLNMFQAAFVAIYEPLRKFHGVLRQYLQDDKGQVGIIIFSGRESNTLAACRCALKIKETFKELSIGYGMGIATGKVFCGPVGDQSRCEMSWIGDSVNHSARLMGMSMKTNDIFVDKASVDAAASEVVFENIGQIALKGKGLVQSYKVNGLKFKGSVLTEQVSEATNMSSPPQMFDNLANVHSATLLDWAVQAATNRNVGFAQQVTGGSASPSPNPGGRKPLKKVQTEKRIFARGRTQTKMNIKEGEDSDKDSSVPVSPSRSGQELWKRGRVGLHIAKVRVCESRSDELKKRVLVFNSEMYWYLTMLCLRHQIRRRFKNRK